MRTTTVVTACTGLYRPRGMPGTMQVKVEVEIQDDGTVRLAVMLPPDDARELVFALCEALSAGRDEAGRESPS